MANCHYITQPILRIDTNKESFIVRQGGITRLKATKKPGLYCNLRYIRVWAGESPTAEFSQHSLKCVYFQLPR